MVNQLLSVAGAGLVLGAYVALQRRWLASDARLYNAMNFLGAAVLTWVAIADRRVGFIVLEAAWALLSIPGMVRPPRRTEPER